MQLFAREVSTKIKIKTKGKSMLSNMEYDSLGPRSETQGQTSSAYSF